MFGLYILGTMASEQGRGFYRATPLHGSRLCGLIRRIASKLVAFYTKQGVTTSSQDKEL